ncbi:5898_t:CDS:2 [Paraglomus brasilianum]|uniref:5898_t:CDS:1 n=1 Tax=Paraglomus brasilianum TaxID=144538 RepID=A0A9N9AY24_9GLOM|nr:5898_t:CDS:2 [Paraglomus brasilianum]
MSKHSVPELDLYTDYKRFLLKDFDPKEYADSTINDTTDGDSNISNALVKLSSSIDKLNKYLHEQVVVNFETLLSHALGIKELETKLSSVHDGIETLNESTNELRSKIYTPYMQLRNYTIQLERLQSALGYLRGIMRFLQLIKCLADCLNDGEIDSDSPSYAMAISAVGELESLIQEVDFEGIEIVERHLVYIAEAREALLRASQQ